MGPMALRVCSLFSGIGGFEIGFAQAGFETVLMCESDPLARAVLEMRFPGMSIRKDIRTMRFLPPCDVLVGGWPCQDLSQAGRTAGISGDRSGLVGEVFRLIRSSRNKPEFIVLENVAFALHLQRGRALSYVTEELEALGYRWAYRILDSRHFGLPQRRRRLFIVGSRMRDPAAILFNRSNKPTEAWSSKHSKIGFYWTEGNTGIGWSPGAVPPLKGGSSFSIPSPPAIWDKSSSKFYVPGIQDAERMQGFASGWTRTKGSSGSNERARWRLVGNAVSVPVAKWIAKRLNSDDDAEFQLDEETTKTANAGTGGPKDRKRSFLFSEGPVIVRHLTLGDFRMTGNSPLSIRAAKGFLHRITKSSLRVEKTFVEDLTEYVS
jgi:DNA (cytosine-5)-methyltransferase 1